MRRREVSQALGAVAEVRTSIRAFRGRVGPKLDARVPPPAGEIPFSYQGYFDHMDVELAQVHEHLTVAEDEHTQKLALVVQLRRQKGEQTRKVYDKQTAARQLLDGYHGDEHGFEVAAVSGPTPQVEQPLAEQVDQTAKRLRHPAVEPPPGRIAGVDLDFEAMALDLENDLGVLLALREYYARTRKETHGTRQTVNAALAELKGVFPWVARSLESLFRLVGERELADRIRTSRRRVTRRQRDEEAAAPAESSSGDGSSTEESASPPAEAAEAAPPPADS